MTTRVLVVGAGKIAPAWFDALSRQDDVDIVGLVDRDRRAAEATARAAGRPDLPLETSLAAALEALASDVVVNLTPPAVHGAVIAAALTAGRDVITEKPLAPTLAEATAAVERAEATGRRVWVMQNRRFTPGVDALRDGIRRGELGELSVMAAELWMSPRHRNTYLAGLPHPFLQDTAIHTLDLARTLVGARPQRVLCHAFSPAGSWHPGTGAAVCIVDFGSVVFEFRGDWAAPGFATGYDGAWRLVGTRGTALWDGGTSVRFQAADDIGRGDEPGGPWTSWPVPDVEGGHPAALRAVLAERAGGPPSGLDARDNLATIALLDAAIASAERGAWVPVAEP